MNHKEKELFGYFKCNSCGKVFSSEKGFSPRDIKIMPCCGASIETMDLWPSLPVKKLLELANKQDINIVNERYAAVVLLNQALELLMEESLCLLTKDQTKKIDVKEILPDNYAGEDIKIKLYNKISDYSLENLLESEGLQGFLLGWESLIKLKNNILRGQIENNVAKESYIIDTVYNDCLKAFLIINNDIHKQIHKSEQGYKQEQYIQEKKKKVLVVEDEEEVRTHISNFIEKQGYTVFVAENGTTAIELYSENRPECVLLDVILPDIDGLNVLMRIKEIDPQANVYFVTGIDGAAFANEAQKLGAKGHIPKPVDLDQIIDLIKNI